MSPIKPSLTARHPREPKPGEVRVVHCSGCGHRFEASAKAISLTCPRCTQPLRFEDVTVDRTIKGQLNTMGHIDIAEDSRMSGKIACGQLTNAGSFAGAAIVHGPVILTATSATSGELQCRSLDIADGASLEGFLKIGNVAQGRDIRPTPPTYRYKSNRDRPRLKLAEG